MKTVTIGDTHGMAAADVVSALTAKFDKLIFMGDYVDPHFQANLDVAENLSALIALKKKLPEKIILLWGNHDIPYLDEGWYYCTGYMPATSGILYELFHESERFFQLSYQAGDYLWTHAGVNYRWYQERFSQFVESRRDGYSLADLLNIAFEERFPAIFDIGSERGGSQPFGGPLWADAYEMISDPLLIFNQIVGHNPVKEIQIVTKENKKIVFTDVLERRGLVDPALLYYLEI